MPQYIAKVEFNVYSYIINIIYERTYGNSSKIMHWCIIFWNRH